jgi:hypothetical protein
MKRLIAALVLCAALLVPAGSTARESYETEIDVVDFSSHGPGNQRTIVSGVLESERAKCEKGRTVKLFLDGGEGFVLQDTGTSSEQGAWALDAPTVAAIYKVKALRANKGGDVCEKAVSISAKR